jgi:hypothetical protein
LIRFAIFQVAMFGQLAILVTAALLGPALAAGRRPLLPVDL